jgi:hypothetical protein
MKRGLVEMHKPTHLAAPAYPVRTRVLLVVLPAHALNAEKTKAQQG